MTDDHGLLRRAMADLAEHGGDADLYDRALTRSRQVRRRNLAVTTGAAAIAVLGIAAGVAVGRPSAAPAPVAGTPSATATTAAPMPRSASPRPSRTSEPPSPETPVTSAARRTSEPPPRTDFCPVRRATLEAATDLSDGWRLKVRDCWHDWASADLVPPSSDVRGDGIMLFRYKPGKGWREHGEGSAWSCHDLGIERIPGDTPPFCSFDF